MGRASMEQAYAYFLNADLTEYTDEWIAVARNKIVAHGKNVAEIYSRVAKEYDPSEIFFARVPGKMSMIF